ncbi:hypothetical protein [Gilvimarinus chinensis]|uniref:hypothetical protein n=1 Tax=Gilvimarinus chinensis TaxID=396005 RepID=UPI000363310B|nr:hypothetical protein [Gilvimarinus chinensis]
MSASLTVPAVLLDNLYSHAIADTRWPEIGLRDLAANELWQLCYQQCPQYCPRANVECVQHSAWFDARCQELLRRNSNTRFISIGAGLNTRFHRLSQSSDWPRFSWWDLEQAEYSNCKRGLLPAVDNYQLQEYQPDHLAAQLRTIICSADTPVAVLMERPALHFNRAQWDALTLSLQALAVDIEINVMFDYVTALSQAWSRAAKSRAGYARVRFTLAAKPTGGGLAKAQLLERSCLSRGELNRRFLGNLCGVWYAGHWRLSAGSVTS